MITLTYFEVRGRIEPARLLLELAGAPYQLDAMSVERWVSPDGKAAAQQHTPFGQLPMLQYGDFTLCQSRAILRYLARTLDRYGSSAQDAARVDEVHETADELFIDISTMHWNPKFHDTRPAHRETLRGKLAQLQTYFERVRADAEHWVVPGRYTLADDVMAYVLESSLPLHPGLLGEFPSLERFTFAFFATPGGARVRAQRTPAAHLHGVDGDVRRQARGDPSLGARLSPG